MLDFRGRPHSSITQRRAERELFFWTAFEALKLILAAIAVLYLVVSLVTNAWTVGELVRVFSGVTRP